MGQNQRYLFKMAEEIQIKKETLYKTLGIIFIGLFLLFAFKNIFADKDQELVEGGQKGSNLILDEGDVKIINLGIANYNYDPNTIKVKQGQKVKIIGNMNQLQGCLKAFVIPQLRIQKLFRSGDNILEFTPTKKGTFGFSCTMGMGTGTLIVE